MIRRLFWLVMGITIGALLVRKLTKLAAALTPSGMAQNLSASLGDLAESIREFAGDVRDAMAERESELREGVGFDGTLGSSGTAGAPGTKPAS
jgi:hypothetical protein